MRGKVCLHQGARRMELRVTKLQYLELFNGLGVKINILKVMLESNWKSVNPILIYVTYVIL